jgi:hypothetical protein
MHGISAVFNVLGLNNVCKWYKAQTTHVSCVERAVIGGWVICILMSDKIILNRWVQWVTDASSYGSRGWLMGWVHDDFHVIWV